MVGGAGVAIGSRLPNWKENRSFNYIDEMNGNGNDDDNDERNN